jgi:hypothetical protein
MLFLFQILFILFILFAISSVIKRRRDGLLGPKGFVFWAGFWALAALAILWPNSTTVLANYLGIGRGADLILYVSLAIMFFALFRLHIKIESIGRDVTTVVREHALHGKNKK